MNVGSGRSVMDIADGGVRGVVTITRGEGGHGFVTAVDLETGLVVQVTFTRPQMRELAEIAAEAAGDR